MAGDLPPSSIEKRFNVAAPLRMISAPVVVSPVKEMTFTSECATNGAPPVSPNPCATLKTPGGRSASRLISASSDAESGAPSAGFRTHVHPEVRQGGNFHLSNVT